MPAVADDDDDEAPELVRVDSWMQSVVPSLPKRAAVVCLVFNILVPGLGTLTGGLLSCCMGRPRYDFHPTKRRCPTAFLVMSIGVAQFLCIAFFFVGWLWSIMWGFLMLNLSDPKFRVLPPPPAPKPPPGSFMRPTVKVVKPIKEVSAGRRNFGRLIEKVQDNKAQALGLAPVPAPATSSASTSSNVQTLKTTIEEPMPTHRSGSTLLSRIPVISCAGGPSAFVANVRSTFSRLLSPSSRSSSQSSLLSERGELESVATERPGNWKRTVASKASMSTDAITEPSSPAMSNGVSTPLSEDANENTFNGIVSVTPATPVHSSDTSSFKPDSDDSPLSVELESTVNVDVDPDCSAALVEMPTRETTSEQYEDTSNIPLAQMNQQVESTSTVEVLTDVSKPAIVGSIKDETVLPNTPDATAEVLPVEVPTNRHVGPISAKLNPTGSESAANLSTQKPLRPKMKQSMTYHFEA